MPSSMIPIFIPFPALESVGPQIAVAPISDGERSRRLWYVTLGQTVTRRSARSVLSCERGSVTAMPLSTTW
jgi:hypothetical protein